MSTWKIDRFMVRSDLDYSHVSLNGVIVTGSLSRADIAEIVRRSLLRVSADDVHSGIIRGMNDNRASLNFSATREDEYALMLVELAEQTGNHSYVNRV